MSDEWMQENFERIRRHQAQREATRRQLENERQIFLMQLAKFGICPCIAMGRYGTCCGANAE